MEAGQEQGTMSPYRTSILQNLLTFTHPFRLKGKSSRNFKIGILWGPWGCRGLMPRKLVLKPPAELLCEEAPHITCFLPLLRPQPLVDSDTQAHPAAEGL